MKRLISRIIIICIIKVCAYGQSLCGEGNATQEDLVTLSAECFSQRYNSQTHDGHKLSQIVDGRLTKYRKILQHLKMHKVKHIETTPVVKWAQNAQKIFINFKLSHRQDSPPCSDIRNQKFIIQNVDKVEGKLEIAQAHDENSNISVVQFASQCFFTNQKFMFRLKMAFNNTLTLMTIDRQGFGTYTIVGDKKEPGIWIDPFEDVHRAAIWQEMRQRHSSSMDEYFQMREQRVEERQQKNRKKKKKRPVAKQADKKQKEGEQL